MLLGKGWTIVVLGCRFSECLSPPSLTECYEMGGLCLRWECALTTLGKKQAAWESWPFLAPSVCQMIPCPAPRGQQTEKREKDETPISSFTTCDYLDFLSAPLTSAPAKNPFNNLLPWIPFFFRSKPSLMMPHSFIVLHAHPCCKGLSAFSSDTNSNS